MTAASRCLIGIHSEKQETSGVPWLNLLQKHCGIRQSLACNLPVQIAQVPRHGRQIDMAILLGSQDEEPIGATTMVGASVPLGQNTVDHHNLRFGSLAAQGLLSASFSRHQC